MYNKFILIYANFIADIKKQFILVVQFTRLDVLIVFHENRIALDKETKIGD
jgi:hypothetical protein